MARYDKYDPISGGFRAPLAAAVLEAAVGIPVGMGLNGSGLAVAGAGVTGVLGVYVPDQVKSVGDIADIMTGGEIVDLDETDFDPGASYFAAAADGVLSTTNTGRKVGFTVADASLTTGVIRSRLVVRAASPATGAQV